MIRLFATLLAAAALAATPARAHTGDILLQEAGNGLRMTVMATPSPLRAGPAEFHVLVQPAEGTAALLDAVVSLQLTRDGDTPVDHGDIWQGGSCCPVTADGLATSVLALATRDDARNRLFHTAIVTIPAAGQWKLCVVATHGTDRLMAMRDLTVGRPQSALESYWAWWAVPPVGIGLFVAHQRLRRAQHPKR